ncbi:MAG: class I SAM-dependent methyltransferase [Candidatus Omnitrophota bacterium]|nr:class I SAM-dependent methyltransferase [Candidatus Omnitrophota bacterium]
MRDKGLMFDINVSALQEFITEPWKHGPHFKALKYILSDSKVLDVGCSKGYIADLLKFKKCYVVGIEKDKPTSNIARKYCNEVITTDIENFAELPYPDGFFDFILCLDVLEHIARPDIILDKLRNYLSNNGSIIVSLPNIARFENRLKLLFGKFDYNEKASAFNKGHLRFFTLKTAKDLVQSAGFRIIKIEYTGLCSIVKVFPALTAFQFLLVAKKNILFECTKKDKKEISWTR